jgi:hypothetical protein
MWHRWTRRHDGVKNFTAVGYSPGLWLNTVQEDAHSLVFQTSAAAWQCISEISRGVQHIGDDDGLSSIG